MRVACIAAVLAALGVTVPAVAKAQARESQLWTGLFLTANDPTTKNESTGLSAWLDVQARRAPAGTTALFRPALGYRLSSRVSVWAGYAWVGAYADAADAKDVIEHRAWQQVTVAGAVGQMTYQLRPRLEQRFRTGESTAVRARLLARANVAFWYGSPLGLASWDEAFFALGDTSWGAPGGFDQNRLFLGLGYTQGAMRIEVGYIGTTVRRADESLLHQHNPTIWAFFAY